MHCSNSANKLWLRTNLWNLLIFHRNRSRTDSEEFVDIPFQTVPNFESQFCTPQLTNPSQIPKTLFNIISLDYHSVWMQFSVMPRTSVRQFPLVHSAKCHSTNIINNFCLFSRELVSQQQYVLNMQAIITQQKQQHSTIWENLWNNVKTDPNQHMNFIVIRPWWRILLDNPCSHRSLPHHALWNIWETSMLLGVCQVVKAIRTLSAKPSERKPVRK